ncbi:hypothetical protein BS78_07G105500 [Paspalum vaginatum]|nr:hypothetical protein BS78_07G105500 [Paspalum vaginatum]KAJ1268036.1 hypothetical protein BS78_07G105500 [Paspalum vaginatum]KAJ1268037.1 hypothetical protein BS78_07G105500 [Paspalum vaginatum]
MATASAAGPSSRSSRSVRLALGGNGLSWTIPAALANLTYLKVLLLKNNNVSGMISDVSLPQLQQFNVSFNQLNGSIPATLRSQLRSGFLGTGLCGGPLGPCPGVSLPERQGADAAFLRLVSFSKSSLCHCVPTTTTKMRSYLCTTSCPWAASQQFCMQLHDVFSSELHFVCLKGDRAKSSWIEVTEVLVICHSARK